MRFCREHIYCMPRLLFISIAASITAIMSWWLARHYRDDTKIEASRRLSLKASNSLYFTIFLRECTAFSLSRFIFYDCKNYARHSPLVKMSKYYHRLGLQHESISRFEMHRRAKKVYSLPAFRANTLRQYTYTHYRLQAKRGESEISFYLLAGRLRTSIATARRECHFRIFW